MADIWIYLHLDTYTQNFHLLGIHFKIEYVFLALNIHMAIKLQSTQLIFSIYFGQDKSIFWP